MMIKSEDLKKLKEKYPVGTRVRLLSMDDPYSKLKPGDLGTITDIDDTGTIFTAWDCGSSLGLVYGADRYEAVEDKPKLPEGKAVFVRKAAGLKDLKEAVREGGKPQPYIIEKQVKLEAAEYKAFTENLLSDYDFIKDNMALMHVDKTGTFHCLLVKEKNSTGGILTESEGYGYPRYTAIYKENE